MPELIPDITDMHRKFEVHEWVAKRIKAKDFDSLRAFLHFRLKFIKEELNETETAFTKGDPEEVVDGLIDIIVVALGTLDAFDVDTQEAWDQVYRANMSKKVGVKETRPNPLGLPDLIKPKGWTGPDHKGNVGLLGKTLNPDCCDCYPCYMRRGY